MPLVFHEIGSSSIYKQTGATVPILLADGLKSKALLQSEGKLPKIENPYERDIRNRAKWIEERKRALSDNPILLESVLNEDRESHWVTEEAVFYKPGHPSHREENIFFEYPETIQHISNNRDWVAIEVPETALLHDPSYRDRHNAHLWSETGVSIKDFQAARDNNQLPYGWFSRYNEYVERDTVSASRIVAYAKLEKEFPLTKTLFSDDQLVAIQHFVNKNLSFGVQFNNSQDNIIINKSTTHYQIRVAFNTVRVKGKEHEISSFFEKFESIEGLYKAAGGERKLNYSPYSTSQSFFTTNEKNADTSVVGSLRDKLSCIM